MNSRKRSDSHRFMGVVPMSFVLVSNRWALDFSVLYCKSSWHVAHHWRDSIINIQRSRTPFAFEICLIPLQSVKIQTRMNHGIHYASICWTFVFISHCILPDHCTAEVNAQMHDHCQSTCRFVSNVFQYFFVGRDPPGYYTTIDFWSGLDNPSDAKSNIISKTSLSQYYIFGV